MITIPQSIMAFLFLCAAGVSALRKRYDNLIVRLMIALFFIYLIIFPDTPIEWTRSISRYLYSLLALVEIISFVAFAVWQKRQGKK